MNMIEEHQDLIVKLLEQGIDVMISISGDLSPLFSIAAPFVKLALNNVESKEERFIKEQFQKLDDRLKTISEESKQIGEEIKKTEVFKYYSGMENNLNNQFRKLMDIFKAKDQKIRDVRKGMFMDSFQIMGKDDLNTLYNAVIGVYKFEEPMLKIVLNCEKSLRPVEKFCTMLKQLFCIGLISLLAFTAMEGKGKEKQLLQEWNEKMKVVQSKIDEVIEECISSFSTQAKLDAERIVRDHSDKNNQELADVLMEHLKQKYDWVCWSVRVFKSPAGLFASKKDFHSQKGKNQFKVHTSDENLNVVISYSASPEPVDKAFMLQLILVLEKNKCIFKRPSMTRMSEQIFATIPYCVVHAVKASCKDLGFSCNFSDEMHFSIKFENFNVFLHSEKRKIEKQ